MELGSLWCLHMCMHIDWTIPRIQKEFIMPQKTTYFFKKLAAIEKIKTAKGLKKLAKTIFGDRYADQINDDETLGDDDETERKDDDTSA